MNESSSQGPLAKRAQSGSRLRAALARKWAENAGLAYAFRDDDIIKVGEIPEFAAILFASLLTRQPRVEDGVTDDRSFRTNTPPRVHPRKADGIKVESTPRNPGLSIARRIRAVRAHSYKTVYHHIHPGAVSRGLTFGEFPGSASIMGESRYSFRLLRLFVVAAHHYPGLLR